MEKPLTGGFDTAKSCPMLNINDLLYVSDEYLAAGAAVREVTVSHRVFGDSKKLTQLRNGADITTGRFNAAMAWFAANWPASRPVPPVLVPYRQNPSSTAPGLDP